ncbi:MAG: class I adenylate-forming enzyme family protein [Paracoccaceae bacterium]
MTAMTLAQAVEHVTTTEPAFAVTQATIRGVEYSVFKNIPGHVRALMQASREKQDNGAADFLVYEDERWTYDAFCAESNRIAQALSQDLGVGKGDRVAIAMRNCPELLVLFTAIASLGAVTVFLNGWWTTEELDYALSDSEARLVFADGERVRRLLPLEAEKSLNIIGVRDGAELVPQSYPSFLSKHPKADWPTVEIDTDDDFAIMYSSGTTGHPKGVVQTHRGAMNAVFTWLMQGVMAPLLDPPAPDAPEPPRLSALVVTPLFHVTATHPVFLTSMPAGAMLAVMAKWDAEDAVRIIRDEGIRRLIGVPTQSHDLMNAARKMGETLPTLEFLGSGGAKRPAAQVGELKEAFPNAQIATGWGMTETNANGIGLAGPEYEARPGVAGRGVPPRQGMRGVGGTNPTRRAWGWGGGNGGGGGWGGGLLIPPIQELRFLEDDGQDVTPGDVGEITVKSPCNMRCYLNKPEATAEVLHDGWLRTGDMGMIDADGIVTIVDRKKNIIIRGGENIACLDVEGALHKHPAVAEACAFSVPHERLGEVVGAGVHLRPGTTTSVEDIRSYLRDHIAHFKIPEHIWFHDSPLPRGATDKLDRRSLRAACLKTLDHKTLDPTEKTG